MTASPTSAFGALETPTPLTKPEIEGSHPARLADALAVRRAESYPIITLGLIIRPRRGLVPA